MAAHTYLYSYRYKGVPHPPGLVGPSCTCKHAVTLILVTGSLEKFAIFILGPGGTFRSLLLQYALNSRKSLTKTEITSKPENPRVGGLPYVNQY